MNIYRVEHKDNKIGPFQNWHIKPSDPECNMPSPWEDGTLDWDTFRSGEYLEYRFGFPSKVQLTDVFSDTERLVKLLRKGYTVSEYLVPDNKVREGDAQCAFKLEDAKFKRWVPVRELKTLH